MRPGAAVAFHDLAPKLEVFRDAVLDGLSRPQKRMPCRFLYDERGSDLFEAICETPEYYPTRTEMAFCAAMRERWPADRPRRDADRIWQRRRTESEAAAARARPAPRLCRHRGVARDSAARHRRSVARLAQTPGGGDLRRFPDAGLAAAVAATRRRPARRVLSRLQHRQFHSRRGDAVSAQCRAMVGPGGGMLIGVDLKKEGPARCSLQRQGRGRRPPSPSTLDRINRELGGNFVVERFVHDAKYDPRTGRVAIHIRSFADQTATVAGAGSSISPRARVFTPRIRGNTRYRISRCWRGTRAIHRLPAGRMPGIVQRPLSDNGR